MDIGIREFKAKLSEYLRRAEAGETIRVTDRGKPRWLIVSVEKEDDPIARGIREGWITPGPNVGGPPRPPFKRVKPKRPNGGSLSIEEDRGE